MKVKYLWAILIALSFFGCDDSTGSLGLGILPDEDKIEVISKAYDVSTNSILSGPVYARTDTAYLGRYDDKEFGSFEASFMTQLNCLDSLRFPEVYDPETKEGYLVKNEIHSTELILAYSKYFGDREVPNHVNIYELNELITASSEIHYTNIDPYAYFNKNEGVLGEGTFTAGDLGTSEEIKKGQYYKPTVKIPLPKKVGEDIFNKNRSNPEYFYNNEIFQKEVFKGIYAEVDQGRGSILYLDHVALIVNFEHYVLDKEGDILQTHDKKDSTSISGISFVNTKEVYQLNKFLTDKEVLEAKVAENKHSYIKSPAGIFTELALPIDQIINDDEIKNDTINSVKLQFDSYVNEDKGVFTMEKPKNLLMIRKGEIKSFFEENKITDNITSYIASINQKGQYIFPNISRLVNTLSEEKKTEKDNELAEDWNHMVLIPVTLDTTVEKDMYGRDKLVVVKIRHSLRPEYAKLKGGSLGDKIKLDMIFTSFNDPSFGPH